MLRELQTSSDDVDDVWIRAAVQQAGRAWPPRGSAPSGHAGRGWGKGGALTCPMESRFLNTFSQGASVVQGQTGHVPAAPRADRVTLGRPL